MANMKRAGLFAGALAAITGLVLIIKAKAGTGPPGPPPPPPPDEDKANLYGRVTDADTGLGIEGVTVGYASAQTPTNGQGDYVIANIPPGMYVLTFTKPGYYTWTAEVDVVKGDNIFHATLNPLSAEPPASFSFSNVQADQVPCGTSSWMTGDFSARITNPNQEPVSLNVTLKWSYFANDRPYQVSGPYPLFAFPVSLQPGESQDVSIPGNTAPEECRFIIGMHMTVNLWLEDETGSRSDVVQLRRD